MKILYNYGPKQDGSDYRLREGNAPGSHKLSNDTMIAINPFINKDAALRMGMVSEQLYRVGIYGRYNYYYAYDGEHTDHPNYYCNDIYNGTVYVFSPAYNEWYEIAANIYGMNNSVLDLNDTLNRNTVFSPRISSPYYMMHCRSHNPFYSNYGFLTSITETATQKQMVPINHCSTATIPAYGSANDENIVDGITEDGNRAVARSKYEHELRAAKLIVPKLTKSFNRLNVQLQALSATISTYLNQFPEIAESYNEKDIDMFNRFLASMQQISDSQVPSDNTVPVLYGEIFGSSNFKDRNVEVERIRRSISERRASRERLRNPKSA